MGFVFEAGDGIATGVHGEHDYVFADGEKVTDQGVSNLVFESGTGLGSAGEVTLRRESDFAGSVDFIEPGQSSSNYYGYTNNGAFGNWEGKLDGNYLTVAVIIDSNGDYDFFYTYTDNSSGYGDDVVNTFSGMEGGYVVQDDSPGGNDAYQSDLSGMEHSFVADKTDGCVIGPFSSGSKSITFTVTSENGFNFENVRIAGPSNFAETGFLVGDTYTVEFPVP